MGMFFVFIDIPNFGLQIGLIILGGLLSLIFFICYFAEKSRYLTINEDKIDLPRGTQKNGKISFRRTVVNMAEVNSIESKLYIGDRVFTKDTYFHTITMKDNSKITFTLYAYGKNEETEILNAIKKRIL